MQITWSTKWQLNNYKCLVLIVCLIPFVLSGCLDSEYSKEERSRLIKEFPIIQLRVPSSLFVEHETYDGWCDEEWSGKRWSFKNQLQRQSHSFSKDKQYAPKKGEPDKRYNEYIHRGVSITLNKDSSADEFDPNIPPSYCGFYTGQKALAIGSEATFPGRCNRRIKDPIEEDKKIWRETKASCTVKKITSLSCLPEESKHLLESVVTKSPFLKYEYCSDPQHKQYVEEVKRRWDELRLKYPVNE